jgi:hypothetical protein
MERWYFYPYCAIRQYKYKDGQTASDLSTIRTACDLSTIQFRLIFKGHKALEHLTSVSTISYAESNGGIFIRIAPLIGLIRQYKCKDERTVNDLSTIRTAN